MKFGVKTCSTCKVILKISFVTQRVQCPCWIAAGNRQHITGLSIYCRDTTCFDRSYLKKRVLLAEFWDKISIFHRRAMMVHSARRIALLLATFSKSPTYKTRETELNRLNYSIVSRFPPPRIEFCSVSSPRAGRVFE